MADQPPAQTPDASKLVVEKAEDFRSLYANSVTYHGNAWDLTITFGRIETIPDGTPGTLVKEHVSVSIPYAQAKLAIYWLQTQVLGHELEAGKIAIRQDVLPGAFPELTPEQQQNPKIIKFREAAEKLRQEFLASLA